MSMERISGPEPRPRAKASPRPSGRLDSRSDHPTRTGAVEIASLDADALMKDACAVLRTGQTSVLLEAIDAGVLAAVMSDQAFWEIGWMSAPTARGQDVDDSDLRRLVAADYLPRIPVVATGRTREDAPADCTEAAAHWLPSVTDVRDRKDIAHAQVARLVSATVVYSHDRHLRGPGYAPSSRSEFDRRVQNLGVVTTQRQHEENTARLVAFAGQITNSALSRAGSLVGVGSGTAWTAMGVVVAAATLWTFTDSPRRQRLAEAFGPLATTVGQAYARDAEARSSLYRIGPSAPTDRGRLEVRLASYLVRNPNRTMSDLVDSLSLGTGERRELSALLRSHPSFEKVSGWGWGVGRVRERLETEPSRAWQPRHRDLT